nr:unnamed protein product [Callosobruchus analis]
MTEHNASNSSRDAVLAPASAPAPAPAAMDAEVAILKPKRFLGVRHVQYALLFSVTILAYALRNVLNVAVIAMVKQRNDFDVPTYPEWESEKNVMLSSFFWGYVLTQIPAGQLAEYFGPKRFLSVAILTCSLFSVLIPVLGGYFGYGGVIVCRIVQGLTQGFIYPSIHHLISAWVPLANRANIASFVYAGGPLGTVMVMPVAGYFSSSRFGWPMAFYTLGAVGLTWTLIWLKLPTPWREIATSLPCWAILICHFGSLWGFWTMLTEIPTYMDKILHFDIKSNSTLSALPYLVYWILNLIMSPIADYLIVNKITSVGVSRKIFNSIGVFIPAMALTGLVFIGGEQRAWTVFALVVAVGFNTAILCGFHVNHIDVAPRHAGTLMGITNALGNCAAILAPLAVDLFKSLGRYDESDKALWNIVFITAAVLFAGTGGSFGARHVQLILMFGATISSFGMRAVLNVAIVAMISKDVKEDAQFPTYPEWSEKKNIILSSFFWGYICFQVFASQLAKNLGVKVIFSISMAIASLFTILIPFFGQQFGYGGVIACRVIQGAVQGFLLPCLHTLLSNWAPIAERAKFGGLVYAGQALGTVVALPVTGAIADTNVGWPVTFYLYGSLGMLWVLCWLIFGYDSPAHHKSISAAERKWIECGSVHEDENAEKQPTPWKSIFTSVPFYAVLAAHCGQNWGFWTLLTETPTYMEKILKFSITKNSLLCALPYFVCWVLNLVMSPIADMLIDRRYVSLIVSRKIFNSIGFFVPALALIGMTFVGGSDTQLAVAILVVAVGFNAGQYSGFNLNHIDISPTYAGTLISLTNTCGTVFSICAPLSVDIVNALTGYQEDEEELWEVIFYIAAGLYLFSGAIFDLFASGDIQPWDNSDPTVKARKSIQKKMSISDLEEIKGPRIGIRHVQIALLFSNLAIAYAMRTNLSVAIVAMTDSSSTTNTDVPTYDWDNKSVILSSFFWGYITMQIFAGELGNRYGTKWLLFAAMFVNSTACMLIPEMARAVGSYGVMGCRVVQGMAQGFFFPSISNLLGQWIPPPERSRMATIVYAGPSLGIIFSMPVTGFIAASKFGWPPSFYFFGVLGYTWMLAWSFLGANSPAQHPKISNEERCYIERTLETTQVMAETPWWSIFSSLPVWAFIVAMFGQNWGYSTLLTEIPTYLNKVMGSDMSSNGMLSAAPYLASFVFCFIFGILSDYLINRGYVTRGAARKIFNSLGTCVPAVALVSLGFLSTKATVLSEAMLIVAVGVNAACFVGFQINPVDLAPNYAGIIMGIGNGSSNIFSIIAPLVVQFVVTDEGDRSLWRIIFITASAVYVSANLFFVLCPLFGCRHAQIILYFSLMTITYCTRTVLSVAIVAMTNNSTSSNSDIPTYQWNNQSVVLSAFFWGYVVLQIPAALAGKKVGPKWLLVGMATVDSVSCLLVPVSAEYLGSSGVIVCRVAQGLAQGGISPMLHMLLGHWAPPSERSVMGSFAYSGSVFGNIIALPITGLICSGYWGWPAAFFAFGTLGLLWVIAWMVLGADRPGLHRGITSCEKKYIESSLGHTEHQVHKTPWKRILKSMPFWAVTVSFVGANWGSAVLITQTPTYLYKILDYDIKSEATLSVVILILNGALQSGGFCGYQVNHMDLSPNHCGILMGITNGTTSVFSIISPLIVQFIVTDQVPPSHLLPTVISLTSSHHINFTVLYTLLEQPNNVDEDIHNDRLRVFSDGHFLSDFRIGGCATVERRPRRTRTSPTPRYDRYRHRTTISISTSTSTSQSDG